ncbi:hypothetical protein Tco_1470672, partial [Tanacetum coccineum]
MRNHLLCFPERHYNWRLLSRLLFIIDAVAHFLCSVVADPSPGVTALKGYTDPSRHLGNACNFAVLVTLLEVDPQNYHIHHGSDHLQNKYTNKMVLPEMRHLRKESHPRRPASQLQRPRTSVDYSLQAIISDGSATISVTCFSDQANTLTRDCNELLSELIDKDPYRLPSTLKELE